MTGPRTVITMLGPSLSGKTTYLMATYGTLCLGRGHLSLNTDANQDHDLAGDWEALCGEGRLPERTADEPQSYTLTFAYDHQPVTVLDCEDYRGGAMSDKVRDDEPDSDTSRLIERLTRTDSVYLVLEASTLMGAETDHVLHSRLLTRRMSALIRRAIDHRRQQDVGPPSVVTLLTKSDLLADRSPGEAIAERLEAAHRRVLQLLPILSDPGMHVAICPVSLGQLGNARGEKVEPKAIRPMHVDQPVTFSVVAHLEAQQRSLTQLRDQLGRQIQQAQQELQALPWHRRARQAELTAQLQQAQDQDRNAEGWLAYTRYWSQQLRPLLKGLAEYWSGQRIGRVDG